MAQNKTCCFFSLISFSNALVKFWQFHRINIEEKLVVFCSCFFFLFVDIVHSFPEVTFIVSKFKILMKEIYVVLAQKLYAFLAGIQAAEVSLVFLCEATDSLIIAFLFAYLKQNCEKRMFDIKMI